MEERLYRYEKREGQWGKYFELFTETGTEPIGTFGLMIGALGQQIGTGFYERNGKIKDNSKWNTPRKACQALIVSYEKEIGLR